MIAWRHGDLLAKKWGHIVNFDLATFVNFTINLCALVILLVVFALSLFGGDMKTRLNRYFMVSVGCNLLSVGLDFANGFLIGQSGDMIRCVLKTGDHISFIATAVQFLAFALYTHEYLRVHTNPSKGWVRAIAAVGAAGIVMATVARFTDLYIVYDAQNLYHKQDLFWVSTLFHYIPLAILVCVTWFYRAALTPIERLSFLAYTVAPFLCNLIEVALPELWITPLGGSITMLLVYLSMQAELRRQLRRQETEIAESRIQLMLNQIQPHFIFNSLSAIVALCEGNPKATAALMTFSAYLRGNMDALTRKGPIPFAQELEHTKQYLALESLRLGSQLHVVYDIQAGGIMLPVLTLQPLVENAVRHGISGRPQGGTITIAARDEGDSFTISVMDDGAGFDPHAPIQDGRSHVGIPNVRDRLGALCGGTLCIESAQGAGTSAVITLPKSLAQ